MSSRIVGTADAMVSGGSDLVVLDGVGFGVTDVVRLADGDARPVPGTDAMKRATESWDAARQIAATGRVYGRSTGVGANRNEDVPTEAAAEHGLRLLRSHAGAIGDELPAREVRAMLAVRANQLLAGGAGLRPTVVTALCEALESGVYPVVNEFGSVGTGDIAALAQVGLALVGEHPWRGAGDVGGAASGGGARRPQVHVPSPEFPSPSPSREFRNPSPSTTTTRSRSSAATRSPSANPPSRWTS